MDEDYGYTRGLAFLHGLTLEFTILVFQEATDRKTNLMLDTRTALALLCKHVSDRNLLLLETHFY